MATVNFYLHPKADKKGQQLVILVVQHQGEKLNHSTGIKLSIQHWDAKRQRVKPQVSHALEMNLVLDKLRDQAQSSILALRLAGEPPTVSAIRARMFPKPVEVETVASVLKTYIAFHRSSRSLGFYHKYSKLLEELTHMGNQRGRPLNFQDMTPAFFDTYIRYLVEDCGNAHNTVAKKLGFLKSFLNWAGKHKHAEKSVAEDLAVPTARKVAHVALTEAELTQMVATHLPDRLARVRDVFCFGCYTGLRFSDIAQLSQANFTHQGSTPALRLTVRKTKEPLVLPLAPQALAIWEHYAGALPVLSNQKTNAYLKEIGQQAGIDSPVQQVRHVGSRVDATTQPKFSLITTHTARRTFATLSAARGMNPIILQRILGHATLNQTLDYIKEIDGTAEMLKVWG